MSVVHPLAEYVRPSASRTANCPGCGNGILAQAILRAFKEDNRDMDDFVFVSGIGCAAWIPSPFFNGDVLHTTHGRPLAFATGVKLAAPDRNVMVISGDGDLLAIGGNHFIHAARRNIDMTVICINNSIYGMTGGQVAPTTPVGLKTMTSPYGNVENSFDISSLAAAAGATFVARWDSRSCASDHEDGPESACPQGLLVHRDHQSVPPSSSDVNPAWVTQRRCSIITATIQYPPPKPQE